MAATPCPLAAQLVHATFSEVAGRQPEAPCVVFGHKTFTYWQIDTQSNRVASHLSSMGVGPGDVVGVLLPRSAHLVVAMLGVLKCGAAYLPINEETPAERIKFMVEDTAAKVVITQEHLATAKLGPGVQGCRPPALLLITPHSLGTADRADQYWHKGLQGSANSCCYIIYTSGSTGQPKGVVIKHKGLSAYLSWFQTNFQVTPADVFLQKTSIAFDASVDELWAPLVTGACVVIAPPKAHRDTHELIGLINKHQVTIASFVPSQLHLLALELLQHQTTDVQQRQQGQQRVVLSAPGASASSSSCCRSLRHVLAGGEALSWKATTSVSAALPHCALHNTYGPTEKTVGITSFLYEPSATGSGLQPDGCNSNYTTGVGDSSTTTSTSSRHMVPATVPIGHPMPGVHLYVLDADRQPVPSGTAGELYVSGSCVAAGYLKRTELTAAVFLPNPFSLGPGTDTDMMYKTGDLVRWLPGEQSNSGLEFLGRVDHQVKLRGYRLELQEVEAAMSALPGVTKAVVGLRCHPSSQQEHLVAWVTPADLRPEALSAALHVKLPSYMVPSVFVLLKALPLLPSEKVDMTALPPPHQWTSRDDSDAAAAADGGLSSDDLLLMQLRQRWADVLGVAAAGLSSDSDFFQLGGNSLLVGLLNSRVQAALQLPEMSGLLLYEHSSLGAFTACVARLKAVDKCGPVKQVEQSGPDTAQLDQSTQGQSTKAGAGGATCVSSNAEHVLPQKQQPEQQAVSARAGIMPFLGAAMLGLSVQETIGLVSLLAFQCLYLLWGWPVLLLLPLLDLTLLLTHLLVAWAAKWLVVGRYREGVYPLYGSTYLRHWVAELMSVNAWFYTIPVLKGTVLLNWFYSAMGASIGRDVVIATDECMSGFDLVTLKDGAYLAPRSAISALSFQAAKESDSQHHLGTMICEPVTVGQRSVVGAGADIAGVVQDGQLVEPCTSSQNPAQPNSYPFNPSCSEALRGADRPLSAGESLLVLALGSMYSSFTIYMPAMVASVLLWDSMSQVTHGLSDTIGYSFSCWWQLPFNGTCTDWMICRQLYLAELLSLVTYVLCLHVASFFAAFLLIPLKKLLLGKLSVEQCRAAADAPWHWRVRKHLLVDALPSHPVISMGAYLWSGTEVYNIWLRGMGMTVGRQAWIGENFQVDYPDLVNIRDRVSICSGVTMVTSTSTTTQPITLERSCDVTNETALYPGVVVLPGAIVGVYTYGAENRVFPANSITQGTLILRPGGTEASSMTAISKTADAEEHHVAQHGRADFAPWWVYASYTLMYAAAIQLMPLIEVVSVISFNMVALGALYYGGWLLLLVCVPLAVMADKASQLLMLMSFKRTLLPHCRGEDELFSSTGVRWQVFGIVMFVYERTLLKGVLGSPIGVWFYRLLGVN